MSPEECLMRICIMLPRYGCVRRCFVSLHQQEFFLRPTKAHMYHIIVPIYSLGVLWSLHDLIVISWMEVLIGSDMCGWVGVQDSMGREKRTENLMIPTCAWIYRKKSTVEKTAQNKCRQLTAPLCTFWCKTSFPLNPLHIQLRERATCFHFRWSLPRGG